jgi:hypothetical protein
MPKPWDTTARRAILKKHKDAYDAAEDEERKTVLSAIRGEINALGGSNIPKRLTKVNEALYHAGMCFFIHL